MKKNDNKRVNFVVFFHSNKLNQKKTQNLYFENNNQKRIRSKHKKI